MQILFILLSFALGIALTYAFLVNRSTRLISDAENRWMEAQSQINVLQEKLSAALESVQKAETGWKEERDKVLQLSTHVSRLETTNQSLNERIAESRQQLEELNQRFIREFELLSGRILEENSKKFSEQNKNSLDQILTPLRDRIREFEKKVDDSYKMEAMERNSLKGEIKNLIELNKQISDEANNLAKALKGDSKKQGNWGEVILERILERSGLHKGSEYDVQVSTVNEEGRRLQPDVIVFLPDNKHLIIDSKVSLVAYEAMVSSDSDEERERFLKEHITSVRNHIKQLSDKQYQQLPGMNSPDFVLLFMPIESSFGLAIQADNELFGYAWDRKIVIVSPSTLLATLRTISSIWKQEKQTRNALEIANAAGGLYDKFVGFLDDMNEIGKRLEMARDSHDKAIRKLSDGSGNIIKRISDLRKMGAKASKELPSAMVEKAEEENQ